MALSKKTLSRLVYGPFTAFASMFIVASVIQIARGTFGGALPGGGSLPQECAEGIKVLALGIDQGLIAAATATDPAEAERRYEGAKNPSWSRRDAIARACTGDASEAMAAMTRLDAAAGRNVRRSASDLARVRRDVDSFIR